MQDKSKEEQKLDAHLKILKQIGDFDERYKSIIGVIETFISQFYIQHKSSTNKTIKSLTDQVDSLIKEKSKSDQTRVTLENHIQSLEKELAEKDTDIYKQELMKPKYENISELIENVFGYLEKIQHLPDFSTKATRPKNMNMRSVSGSSKNSLSPSPVGMKSNTPQSSSKKKLIDLPTV